ncbi:DgyrCDS2895 [Dimorphilus gyrociliatus]|uniref:DgyrCDS2895 n=1 Tax=Dimorphilus gyrociliatus TaxID=2664684 RepID=A0A7I8VDI2_9ANNE|nr:DgyrCDS2895 [Dimorphilus gyrociliatus]
MKYFQILISFLLLAVTAAFYFTDDEDFGIPIAGKRSNKFEKLLKFKPYDSNGDGFLTEQEFAKLLKSKFRLAVTRILFKLMDTNQDRVLNSAELKKYFQA